ncbi:hypothetical protein AX14_009512, partial [Amanita brunnescens Koide BX004]
MHRRVGRIPTVSLNAHTTKDFHPGQGGQTRSIYAAPALRAKEPLKTLPATMADKGERGETEKIARERSGH